MVLISEPTGKEKIVLGEKGMITLKLKARGRSSHGSIPSHGENAIVKIVNDIGRLCSLDIVERSFIMDSEPEFQEDMGRVTVNVGTVKGGIKSNVVPDYCEAEVDVRVPLTMNLEDMMEKIKGTVKESEVEVVNSSPPNFTHPSTPHIQVLEKAISEVTGNPPVKVAVPYSTDGKHFRRNGTSVIVYGPGDIRNAHSVDEFVDMDEVNTMYKVYSNFLRNIRF